MDDRPQPDRGTDAEHRTTPRPPHPDRAARRLCRKRERTTAQWSDLNLDRRRTIIRAVLDHAVVAPSDTRGGSSTPNESICAGESDPGRPPGLASTTRDGRPVSDTTTRDVTATSVSLTGTPDRAHDAATNPARSNSASTTPTGLHLDHTTTTTCERCEPPRPQGAPSSKLRNQRYSHSETGPSRIPSNRQLTSVSFDDATPQPGTVLGVVIPLRGGPCGNASTLPSRSYHRLHQSEPRFDLDPTQPRLPHRPADRIESIRTEPL